MNVLSCSRKVTVHHENWYVLLWVFFNQHAVYTILGMHGSKIGRITNCQVRMLQFHVIAYDTNTRIVRT